MSGLAVKILNSSVINVPVDTKASDYCACDFWCEWEEPVFADTLSTNTWKRDYSDFLFRKVTASDTITIELYRYGTLVATITDSTYGTYYSTFTNQPLYVGWVADWSLIFAAFSGGQYQVKMSGTIAGASVSFESRKFRLQQWNEKAANETVKIESYQDGNILSSEFDFTGLIDGGWYSSIRLNGRFGNKTPVLEVDEYLNTSYEMVQNRTQVKHEYTLDTRYVPYSVLTEISDKDLIGNQLYITDYSLMSKTKYDRIPVVATSFDEVVSNDWYNGEGRFVIKFGDRVENTIKRNY